jgi:hypothetical protein
MEELIGNWLLQVGTTWLFSAKCSQCWSTDGLYRTNCCSKTLCGVCAQKQVQKKGWILKKTTFTCPCCNTEIKL